MRKTLLLFFTLSGLSSLSSCLSREYHYVAQKMLWTEAQSHCRATFTDLATIDNQEDNDRLLTAVQTQAEPTKKAWIGLYDDMSRWQWSLGNEDYDNITEYNYWQPGEPNFAAAKENCTVMDAQGFWLDVPCDEEHGAVCYYDRGPAKYILVTAKMTWQRAQSYCEADYTDLASVRNMTEHYNISTLLSGETDYAWIGLHRRPFAYWSDGSTSTFTNWEKKQPDNLRSGLPQCVSVDMTVAKWYDARCDKPSHFFCETVTFPPSTTEPASTTEPLSTMEPARGSPAAGSRHKTTFKLKIRSEADMSDPAVQRQVLQQLHAKLEKHGLPDFKLRWVQTDGHTFHKEQKREKQGGDL
ncbi:putative C-type lectin domain family 20 member A [Centroberyx affinis]|uniref:putative C-type lectin domain family 20 member A n=1 Tax=Centroberyx affinis TaxID=166261 RepID=UPI003A5C19A5